MTLQEAKDKFIGKKVRVLSNKSGGNKPENGVKALEVGDELVVLDVLDNVWGTKSPDKLGLEYNTLYNGITYPNYMKIYEVELVENSQVTIVKSIEAECTCISLIYGHMNDCPYMKGKS